MAGLEPIIMVWVFFIFGIILFLENEVLRETGLVTLSEMRQTIVNGLFNDVVENNQSKLHKISTFRL